jgi:hypothetical protein
MPKVDSAQRTLFEVNPEVKARTHAIHLDASRSSNPTISDVGSPVKHLARVRPENHAYKTFLEKLRIFVLFSEGRKILPPLTFGL